MYIRVPAEVVPVHVVNACEHQSNICPGEGIVLEEANRFFSVVSIRSNPFSVCLCRQSLYLLVGSTQFSFAVLSGDINSIKRKPQKET
jgi:hypothetical protein